VLPLQRRRQVGQVHRRGTHQHRAGAGVEEIRGVLDGGNAPDRGKRELSAIRLDDRGGAEAKTGPRSQLKASVCEMSSV
jgi:hypothetical protein